MRLPRTRLIVRASLAAVVLLALGINWREDRYSCHLCRALKEKQTTSLLAWPLWWRENPAQSGDSHLPHRHDWLRYSYSYRNGLGGCLRSGVACRTDGRYRDGRGEPGTDSGLLGPG